MKNKTASFAFFVFSLFIFTFAYVSFSHLTHISLPTNAYAAQLGSCPDMVVPIAALPGQPFPIWCYQNLTNPPMTATVGANSWVDTFDSGTALGSCCTGYTVFSDLRPQDNGRADYWTHNNHWMVDSKGKDSMMRPNKTFRFENGKLVIEADVAASVEGYTDAVWAELDVTTASAPTFPRRDAGYAYDEFAGHYTFGCRLQSVDRHPTCTFFNNNTLGAGENGRLYEISFFQTAGANVFGGGPWGTLGDAWRVCKGTDPDINCRERFRWEITKTTSTVFVNGVKYMEHVGLPPLPDEFLQSDLYVYFSTWNGLSSDKVARFHWDRVAVNPASGPGAPPADHSHHSSPRPSSQPVSTPTPTPTPTPQPSANVSPTPQPTTSPSPALNTKTAIEIAAAGTVVNGTYPTLEVSVKENGERKVILLKEGVRGNMASQIYEVYSVDYPEQIAVSQIRLAFINDAYNPLRNEDRNLYIHYMKVNGVQYDPSATATLSMGSWSSQNGCGIGFKRSATLHCNGFFIFDL